MLNTSSVVAAFDGRALSALPMGMHFFSTRPVVLSELVVTPVEVVTEVVIIVRCVIPVSVNRPIVVRTVVRAIDIVWTRGLHRTSRRQEKQ